MSETPVDYAAKIKEAYERIKSDIRKTPVEYSEPLSRETGAKVYIKWECDQTTGSFKLRGALNKLRSLSPKDRAKAARGGAKNIRATIPRVPAMKEPKAAIVKAAPARPRRAIWWPSMAVTTEAASPGTLSRIDVVDPPYMAP